MPATRFDELPGETKNLIYKFSIPKDAILIVAEGQTVPSVHASILQAFLKGHIMLHEHVNPLSRDHPITSPVRILQLGRKIRAEAAALILSTSSILIHIELKGSTRLFFNNAAAQLSLQQQTGPLCRTLSLSEPRLRIREWLISSRNNRSQRSTSTPLRQRQFDVMDVDFALLCLCKFMHMTRECYIPDGDHTLVSPRQYRTWWPKACEQPVSMLEEIDEEAWFEPTIFQNAVMPSLAENPGHVKSGAPGHVGCFLAAMFPELPCDVGCCGEVTVDVGLVSEGTVRPDKEEVEEEEEGED
ncbi:MAG: hypothetical protein Q9218_007846, partial [Villophora microphyllina]